MPGANLTISEAAQGLKCSRRSIWNYFKRGQLVADKQAGKTFVTRASYEKFLQKRGKEAGSLSPLAPGQAVVSLSYLEGLLTALGQFQAKERFLLEYQNTNEILQARLNELEEQLARARKKSWLQKMLDPYR